jgi:hypothetical protein
MPGGSTIAGPAKRKQEKPTRKDNGQPSAASAAKSSDIAGKTAPLKTNNYRTKLPPAARTNVFGKFKPQHHSSFLSLFHLVRQYPIHRSLRFSLHHRSYHPRPTSHMFKLLPLNSTIPLFTIANLNTAKKQKLGLVCQEASEKLNPTYYVSRRYGKVLDVILL